MRLLCRIHPGVFDQNGPHAPKPQLVLATLQLGNSAISGAVASPHLCGFVTLRQSQARMDVAFITQGHEPN